MNGMAEDRLAAKRAPEIKRLKRRLAIHRRRLRYWSGNPDFGGYGPTGKSLQPAHMDMQYEIAVHDAFSIAGLLADLGVHEKVVDPRATFRARWSNPQAAEVLLWPL